jgi:DNA-binding beta-propeller fold protein YncE
LIATRSKQVHGVTRLAAVVLAGLLLSACAGKQAPKTTPDLPVWPPPPQQERIQFVRSIVGEDDLHQDTTFSQKVIDLLAGGAPPARRIAEPMGIAVSDDGQRVYVSSQIRSAVSLFDFENDVFSEIEGLNRPLGLVLDAEDRLYIVEQGKKGVSVYDRDHNFLRFLTHPSIERPTGIALDRERGRLYVCDTGSRTSEDHSVKIFNLEGELTGAIGEGKGGAEGKFLYPTYVALDGDGNLYVADSLNSRVQVFDPEGNYVKTIGERGNGWGMFDKPKGVALDSFGNIYVADSGWSNVQIFNQRGEIMLFFGGFGPLPGMMKNPTALTIDRQNRIYVADFINHRVNIYQLVNTKAGDSFRDSSAEGGAPVPEAVNDLLSKLVTSNGGG